MYSDKKELKMDKVLKSIPGVGEVGIDTSLSHTRFCYYAKLYNGSYNAAGFESQAEAEDELDYAVQMVDQ